MLLQFGRTRRIWYSEFEREGWSGYKATRQFQRVQVPVRLRLRRPAPG